MSNHSDSTSPETDAKVLNTIPRSTNEGYVSADFARNMERQRDAARAERDENIGWREQCQCNEGTIARLKRKAEALQSQLDAASDELPVEPTDLVVMLEAWDMRICADYIKNLQSHATSLAAKVKVLSEDAEELKATQDRLAYVESMLADKALIISNLHGLVKEATGYSVLEYQEMRKEAARKENPHG